MPESILQTASPYTAGVIEAVAYRLSCDEWTDEAMRSGIGRMRAKTIANRIVPIVLDAMARSHSGNRNQRAISREVRRAVGWWQALLWRAVIAIVVRWLVDWWFSDRSAAYRAKHVGAMSNDVQGRKGNVHPGSSANPNRPENPKACQGSCGAATSEAKP